MWIIKTQEVAEHERALLFRNDNFVRILGAGRHRFASFGPWLRVRFEKYDLTNPVFVHRLADFLVKVHSESIGKDLERVETGEHEVGVVRIDGRLHGLLAPATRNFFWKPGHDLEVDRVNLAEGFEVGGDAASLIRQLELVDARGLSEAILSGEVREGQVGLLVVDGEIERVLEPGPYAFWKFNRSLRVLLVAMQLQTVDVAGQEILTKDKVSLRLNLTASFRVRDPIAAHTATVDYAEFLYRELQLGLREAVGTRTLDQILAEKEALNEAMEARVRGRVEVFGLELESVGVKDIILPGEMKTILNQVVEAEKAAQANLIRRREETAATRSLHNTAKLLEQSPVLMRLKELETLEKVTERVGSLTVLGGLEGVLDGLVRFREQRG